MRSRPLRLLAMTGAALLAGARLHGAAVDPDFFEKRIRPVLVEHCQECHGATGSRPKGGLRLDSREALRQGGETGPAIVEGKPAMSLLFQAMAHRHPDLAMPPKKPRLAPAILADFETWITAGAPWPAEPAAPPAAGPGRDFDLAARKQQLPWIWQKPQPAPPPEVTQTGWPQGPIDRFILQRLEQEGLAPSPPAEPNLWLRRVYFALTGLPPSPGELADFLHDPSPAARARVVDRLLASPQFGERWGRHWLDLVRYAESRGHEGDYVIPNAYEYRDYVIRALNADVRYDDLLREHVAGDLLPRPRRNPELGFNESVLGTGWAFLGEEIHAPVDTRLDETERIDNRIDVLTKSFLGLTVSCARCHDHKFDAVSQRDYYALAGFFISTGQRLARFETMEQEREAARNLARIRSEWSPVLARQLAEAQAPVLDRLWTYLVAAAEIVRWGPPPAAGRSVAVGELPPGSCATASRLAADHQLDPDILLQWSAALLNAVQNPADALHPFAAIVFGRRTETSPAPAEAPLPAEARVIVDYAALRDGEWWTDGFGFGSGPRSRGELQVVASDPGRPPLIQWTSRPAARTDADWRRLGLRPGVEREPTLYGGWKREGAILRTPKFELKEGRLHYLVRGSGRIVAVVDSQRLITGPVHTGLVREWARRDHWHWISHDLTDYRGHRVAVEFSPGNDLDTAVALVIESAEAPAPPVTAASAAAGILSGLPGATVAAAADVYADLFRTVSRPGAVNGTDAAGHELAAWMADRPALFSGRDGRWPDTFNACLDDFARACAPVLAPVSWNSRTAPAMMEGNGVDEYLLVRGKHHSPRGLVTRRFLEAVAGPDPITDGPGSGRLELAEALTSPDNPLVARVLVNRVWHHLFGRGIVATVDNFGLLGQRPSHPELLDHLADTFIREDGWSLKRLIRRLVLSSTYAQSSRPSDPATEERDPENILLHRMNLMRLEGEAIRDAILTVSGRLDRTMYGVSVPLHPSQFVEARGLRSERGPLDGHGRRSIYVAARRNFLPMMMTAFDLPTPFTTVGRRNLSNVPGQMLFLMNDPFIHEQAGVWSRRLQSDLPAAGPDERIRRLYLAAFSREPLPREIDRCRETLRQLDGATRGSDAGTDPWTELCHALIGVKEFIFIR